eukprot:711981-Prymnesium_polylepis.2
MAWWAVYQACCALRAISGALLHRAHTFSLPETAQRHVCVAGFMLLEAYKPLILRKVWLLGFASAAFTLVLMYIMYQTRHSAMSVLSLMSSIGLLAASVVGWWTCNNKKDDLNMLRSVEHFQKCATGPASRFTASYESDRALVCVCCGVPVPQAAREPEEGGVEAAGGAGHDDCGGQGHVDPRG